MKYVYTSTLAHYNDGLKESQANFCFSAGLIDRTKSIISKYQYVEEPFPTETTTKNFVTIAYETAENIKAQKKPIYLFWSGGIDSTLVLAYLKKIQTPNIFICCSDQIRLSSFIGTYYKTLFYESTKFQETLKQCLDNGIVVTGEFGDQLFGSSVLTQKISKDGIDMHLEEPTESNLLSLMQNYLFPGTRELSQVKSAFEFTSPVFNSVPFPINTCHDYFWWINFTCKWNSVKYRFYNGQQVYKPENLIHFYENMDFQKWAITEENHRNEKYKNRIYKQIMLEQIDQLGFDKHLFDRVKVGSLDTRGPLHTLYIDENFNSCLVNSNFNSVVYELIESEMKKM